MSQGFSADGRSFLTRGGPVEITAWDLQTGRPSIRSSSIPIPWRVHSKDRGAFVGMLGSAERGDAELVWADAASDVVRARLLVGSSQAWHLAWGDGDRSIRVVVKDRRKARDVDTWEDRWKGLEVVTWDLASGVVARRSISGPRGAKRPIPLAYSADGRLLAIFDHARGGVQVWDVDADQPKGKLLPDPSKITDSWRNAEFTRDGRTLVVGRTDGQAEVWDLAESRLTRMIKIHPGGFAYVQPSPDGRLLASMVVTLDFPPFLRKARVLLGALLPGWSRTDQEVALFDLATGQELARFPGASDVEFSPDGRTIVTREWDGTFSVRDAPRPLGR